LFASLPDAEVPALDLLEFAVAAPEDDATRDPVPRDSVADEDEPVERPAVTGEKWLCCIDCCRCAVCCWNDSVRAVVGVPAKCSDAVL
jgi:hypothetical protein